MVQIEERHDISSIVKKKESVIILEILSEQRSVILNVLLGFSNQLTAEANVMQACRFIFP